MKKIVRILRPLFFVLFFVLVSQQALIVWLVANCPSSNPVSRLIAA